MELQETVFPPLFKYHSFHVTTLRVPLHWGMITLRMPRDVLKQKDRENTKDTSALPGAAYACRNRELGSDAVLVITVDFVTDALVTKTRGED